MNHIPPIQEILQRQPFKRLPWGLPGHGAGVSAEVTATAGKVVEPVTEHVPQTGGWRLYFEYRPEPDEPAQLEALLREGERIMTETWRYSW